jgi:hypothetical protein
MGRTHGPRFAVDDETINPTSLSESSIRRAESIKVGKFAGHVELADHANELRNQAIRLDTIEKPDGERSVSYSKVAWRVCLAVPVGPVRGLFSVTK